MKNLRIPGRTVNPLWVATSSRAFRGRASDMHVEGDVLLATQHGVAQPSFKPTRYNATQSILSPEPTRVYLQTSLRLSSRVKCYNLQRTTSWGLTVGVFSEICSVMLGGKKVS